MFFYFSIIFYILLQGLYEKMVKVNVVEIKIIRNFSDKIFFEISIKLWNCSQNAVQPVGAFFFYSKTGFFSSQQKVQSRMGLHSVWRKLFSNCPGTWRNIERSDKIQQPSTVGNSAMFFYFSIIFYILLQGLYEKMVTLRPPLKLIFKTLSVQKFFQN